MLLHSHLIGADDRPAGGDVEAWRNFLLLLGRDAGLGAHRRRHRARLDDDGRPAHRAARDRLRGGAARAIRRRSRGLGPGHRQLPPGQRLRARRSRHPRAARHRRATANGSPSSWPTLEARGDGAGGIGAKTAALMRMLRGIVEAVSKDDPERLEPVLRNMAAAVGQCSPDMLLGLMGQRGDDDEGPRLVQAVVSRMTDTTIARFVSRHVIVQRARRPIAWRWRSSRSCANRISSSGCSRSRTTTSPRRRSAAPKASRRSGTTSPRSC